MKWRRGSDRLVDFDAYFCEQSLQHPELQRRDFRDSSGTKPGALFPLGEIWMPVQAEVLRQ